MRLSFKGAQAYFLEKENGEIISAIYRVLQGSTVYHQTLVSQDKNYAMLVIETIEVISNMLGENSTFTIKYEDNK